MPFFMISTRMFIDNQRKFIFFRTKKTAGTSIEIYLESVLLPKKQQELSDKRSSALITENFIVGARGNHREKFYDHMRFVELHRRLPQSLRNIEYYKFCSVRNPFDKAVSRFWWESVYDTVTAQRLGLTNLNQLPFSSIKEKFKSFIQTPNWLQDDRKVYLDDHGKLLMDGVIRTEHLKEDLEKICDKLGIPFIIEKLGNFKSNARARSEHYRDYYDGESIDIVTRHCLTELMLFGYTF